MQRAEKFFSGGPIFTKNSYKWEQNGEKHGQKSVGLI